MEGLSFGNLLPKTLAEIILAIVIMIIGRSLQYIQ